MNKAKYEEARKIVTEKRAEGVPESVIRKWIDENGLDYENLKPANKLIGGARAIGQGAGFNWTDELEAGGRAMFSDRSYPEIRDEVRSEIRQYSDENPKTAFALEMAGAVGSGYGLGRKMIGEGVELGYKQLGKLGATEGALFGSGSSEGDLTKVEQAAPEYLQFARDTGVGAAMGSLTGLGTQAVIDLIKKAYAGSPMSQAGRHLLQALEDGRLSVEQALERMKALGPYGMLAHNPELHGISKGLTNAPGPTQNRARAVLDDIQAGQQDRLIQAQKDLTGTAETPLEARQNLDRMRENEVRPLYEAAEKQPVQVTDRMVQEATMTPEAMGPASRMYRYDTGIDLPVEDLQSGQLLPEIEDLSFWDSWKKAMDDVSDKAARGGEKHLASGINESKKRALADFDTPEYTAARNKAQEIIQAEQALEAGRKVFAPGKYAEEVAEDIAQMNPFEKKHFVIGALRQLREQINRGSESADAARKLIQSPAFRDKMRNAFPDDDSFNEFMKVAKRESTFSRTRNATHPGIGSHTAQLQQQQSVLADPITMTADILDRPAWSLMNLFKNQRKAPAIPQDVNRELGRALFTPGARGEEMVKQILESGKPKQALPFGTIGLLNAIISQGYGDG